MSPLMRTAYFLGAGATHADFPDVPLGDDLLHVILKEEPEGSSLRGFLEQVFEPDSLSQQADQAIRPRLDDVFTAIDAGLAGRAPIPRSVSRDQLDVGRHLLVAAIARVIDARLGNKRGSVAERFAQILRDTSGAVLSTNYDIAIDNALLICENVHYGVTIRSPVGQRGWMPEGREQEMRHFSFDALSDTRIRGGTVPLLKLHGSLNWLYCPRCDELDITPLSKGAVEILNSPEKSRCSVPTCTGRYEAILVGPSLEQRYENRILRETWSLAEQVLREAERLVIIGYSLPEADYLIRNILSRHFAKRSECVTVVSRGIGDGLTPNAEVEGRYQRLFPRCVFRWDGFVGLVNSLLTSDSKAPR